MPPKPRTGIGSLGGSGSSTRFRLPSISTNTGFKIEKVGEWATAQRILMTAPARIKIAMDRAAAQEAQFFRKKIVEGFRTQEPGGQKFKPLSDFTLAVRRFTGNTGTKALIDSGDLRNSVKVVKVNDAHFVGVHRTAKSKKGKDLVNIAEIHEYGVDAFVVEVTPKMRKFLMAVISKELGSESGTSTGAFRRGFLIIKIPKRPFLAPVFEKYGNPSDAKRRFANRVGVLLNGDLGFVLG